MFNEDLEVRDGVVYDIEIKKCIQGEGEELIEGIEYCDGWRDFENMGIATLVAFDLIECRTHVFLEDNMDDFRELMLKRSFGVTYNGVNFDNELLKANDIDVTDMPQFDVLRQIWASLGLNPDVFNKETHKHYGLGRMMEANFGTQKTLSGELAPVLWQRGKYGQVINYCSGDVWGTTDLFAKIVKFGVLDNPQDPNTPIRMLPWSY